MFIPPNIIQQPIQQNQSHNNSFSLMNQLASQRVENQIKQNPENFSSQQISKKNSLSLEISRDERSRSISKDNEAMHKKRHQSKKKKHHRDKKEKLSNKEKKHKKHKKHLKHRKDNSYSVEKNEQISERLSMNSSNLLESLSQKIQGTSLGIQSTPFSNLQQPTPCILNDIQEPVESEIIEQPQPIPLPVVLSPQQQLSNSELSEEIRDNMSIEDDHLRDEQINSVLVKRRGVSGAWPLSQIQGILQQNRNKRNKLNPKNLSDQLS